MKLAVPLASASLALGLTCTCTGTRDAVPSSTTAPPTAQTAASEPGVPFRRIDARAAELLTAGAEATVWEHPNRATIPPRNERFAAQPDGSIVLSDGATLVTQISGRAHGKVRLIVRGEARGAPALAHLFSIHLQVPNLAATNAVPLDMQPRIHTTLATLELPPGEKLELASPPTTGDPQTAWFFLSVESGLGGEFTLDRVALEEWIETAPLRHSIGGETRLAVPLAAGAARTFELPSVPRGALIEFAVAPPDGMLRLAQPMSVHCSLDGSDERTITRALSDSPSDVPVHRFESVVFHASSGLSQAQLRVSVTGPEGSVLVVALPKVVPRRDATTPPNLLLFSIDTLRADHVGAWGAKAGATPNLDRFAAQSFRFARCYSPANFTIPAHASMMTGLQPAVHGALRFGERVSIRALPNLAGACANAGMLTVAFTGGGFVDATFGFDENFSRYEMLDPLMTEANPRYLRSPRRTVVDYNRRVRAHATLHEVTDWLAAHADRRFFLFLHTYHAHDYSPSDASARRFGADPNAPWAKPMYLDPGTFPTIQPNSPQLLHYQALYDAAISEVDHAFGELLAELKRDGLLENTVILVTADHGEAFQEHGTLFHTVGLHNEVLHVPMLLRAPGLPIVGTGVIDTPVSLIDVAPTLLELVGAEPLIDAQGVSLVPLLRGGELVSRPLLAQDCPAPLPNAKRPAPTHSALIQGRFKFVRQELERGVVEHLYDLVDDPRELVDRALDPALADALVQARAALDRTLDAMSLAAEGSKARREQLLLPSNVSDDLNQLGYR